MQDIFSVPDISKNISEFLACAPINSKLQHPPRAYPWHLTVHCAREGGNLNVALEGWVI